MNKNPLKPGARPALPRASRWISCPLSGLFLASALASLLPQAARAQAVEDDVVINEFIANPTAPLGREYIELLVVKPGGVDMRGWTLADPGSRTAPSTTSPDEGAVTLPNADYLSAVPQGTHVVVVLSQPSTLANTLPQDLSNTDGNKKLVLVVGETAGITTIATLNLSTNENIQLYSGPLATGTIIDQVLAGTNATYVPGATFGDNNSATTGDNIDGNRSTPVIDATPGNAAVRFVPDADTLAEFGNNDTGAKYFIDTAPSYGTPGEANTGVTENSLSTSPGTLQFSAATYAVGEEGGTATITVTRSGGATGAVSAAFATADGTATAGQDYTSTSGTISFADGEGGSKTFSVPILNDATPNEPAETVTLTLSAPTGGTTLGAQSTATLSIVDDDQPGTFALESAAVSAAEGTTAAFVVTRTAGTSGAVSIPFTLSGGTAIAGQDFPLASASGTLQFTDGQLRATIEVPLTDDAVIGDNTTATLQLGQPTGGGILGAQTSSALTIVETDRAGQLLINEVKAEDLGADEPFEFIEVRGTPGALLTNIFVLLVNGPAATAGTVGRAYDLSGQRIGSNGLLIIKSTVASYTAIPAETTIVGTTTLDATGGLSNGAASFVLGLFPPGTVAQNTDLDANNDGTLELPANASVIDAVGYKNGGVGDVVYGPEVRTAGAPTLGTGLSATAEPPDEALEAITRFPNDTTPLSAAAFYGGTLTGTGATTNTYDSAQPNNVTANFPTGGVVTPGAPNAPAPPANAVPDAVDDTQTVAEDAPATALQVLANDTDPDANTTLAVTNVTQGTNGGTVAIGANGANVTYTPGANAVGSDTFTYTISDGAGGTDTATVTVTITPVDDAPTFAPIAPQTVAEDAAVQTIDITGVSPGGGADEAGQTVTFTATSSNPALVPAPTITGTGTARTLSFRPAPNASGGPVTITVTAEDTGSGTAPAANTFSRTFTITVAPSNDAPLAVDDTATLAEDAPARVLQVLANDTDPDANDTLRVSEVTQGTKGTVAIGAGGANVTYTPNANANGSDSFTYTITDGTAFSMATVNVTITPVNDAPSGQPDTFTVSNNGVLSVAAPGVLDNDSDAEGQALTAALVAGMGPTHGQLTLNANGSFSYDPDDTFVGSDTFSYTASDGAASSAPIAVTIQVTQGPNSAPTISPIAAQSTGEDTPTGPIAFAVGDGQTAPADLEVTATSSNAALIPAGNIVLGGSGANRTITLAPAADASGTATITVTVSDGALSAQRTFVLSVAPVNDAPAFAPIADQTVAEDAAAQTIAITGVSSGGADDEAGQAVTLSATSSNPALIPNPTISGTGSTRTLSLRPTANASGGPVTITVTAMDAGGGTGGNTNTFSRAFSVTVTPVNDAPTALPQTLGTGEDEPLAITLRASDVDSNVFSFTIESPPTRGTLSRVGSPTGPALVYTPNADFAGSDSFSFRANDGTDASAPATVSITVGGQNDAPRAAADAASTNEDTPVNVQVLANDSDAEGDALRLVRVATTSATNGAVSINTDGSLRFVPRADFSGPATFAYVVSDGALESSATVTIQVVAVNDAPLAQGQSVGTREETPVSITLGATDIDSRDLSFTITTPPRGGTLSGIGATRRYTPAPDFVGTDSFAFQASDGALLSPEATVTITVGGDNDAPVAQADSARTAEDTPVNVRVLQNDLDPERDALRLVRVITGPATRGSVSINADGSLRFVPVPNFNGVSTFSYVVSDGVLEATALVTIQVQPQNDAPTAQDDAAVVRSGQAVEVPVLANDTDADGDALSISTVDATGARGSVSISEDRRRVSFRPEADFSGATSFGYTLSDGGAVSTARVAVQVLAADAPLPVTPTPVTPTPTPGANSAPVAVADSYAVRGPLQVLAARGVLANDVDAQGDRLVARLDSVPAHGTISFKADGSFVYTPGVNYAGRDSFTYAANDGKAESKPVSVVLQVAQAPDVTPPVVVLAGGAQRTARTLPSARGAAVDVYAVRGRGLVVTSGLKSVVLQLQRPDGQYWNGTAYQRAPFDLRTQMLDRSFFASMDVLPSGSLTPDGVYKLTAVATDNAGNVARALQNITVDATPPSLLILSPQGDAGNEARLARLNAASGRAAGASQVEVALRRADGSYWNQSEYQPEPFFQAATLTGGAWSLASGLPSGSDLPPGRYALVVRARDEAGNATVASRTIIVSSIATG